MTGGWRWWCILAVVARRFFSHAAPSLNAFGAADIMPPICLDLTAISRGEASSSLFPANARVVTVNSSEYFVVGDSATTGGAQRWRVSRDAVFAWGRTMKDVIKLKEDELTKIPLVDGRSEEDDAAAS